MAEKDQPPASPPARLPESSGPPAVPERPAVPEVPAVPGPPVVPEAQPAPAPASQMDAEQFRKFQEFQQFQEFQRYREETGQLPPAPKPPLWKRALRSKLVRKLVVLLILLIAAYWAYQHYFGKNDSDNAIEAGGGGRTKTNFVFSDNPMAMVRQLYDNVAQNIVVDACNRFTDDARQKFTADLGAPSCELAVTTLNSKLTNKHKYSLPRPGSNFTIPPGAKTIEISSCDLRVEGGPRIGVFVLSEIELGQWIITGHRNEPDPCPAGAR